MQRVVVVAAMVLALAGACRGKGRSAPHDAREDNGASSGVAPPARDSASGTGSSGTGSAGPPVTPPPGGDASGNVASCTTVGNAIVAWQRIDQLYTELLPLAKAAKPPWTVKQFDAAVDKRYGMETPGGGRSGAPGPYTSMCDCTPRHVDEACTWFAANGKPPIVCDAARKHEAVHAELCDANRTAGWPEWQCVDNVPNIGPDLKARHEHAAYEAHLAVLRDWFAAQRCSTPPGIHPCSLVGDADAATALGRPIESVEGTRMGVQDTCTFWGEHSHDEVTRPGQMNKATVAVGVVNAAITLEQFKTRTLPSIEPTYRQTPIPIEGLGDAAVAIGPGDKVSGSIMVHQGTRVFTITVWVQRGTGSVDYLAAAKQLGAIAVKRLPK